MNAAHLKQSVRRATVDFVVEKVLTLSAVTVVGPLVIYFVTRTLADLGTLTWLVILGTTVAGIVIGQRRYGWQRRIYRYHYPKVSFRYEVLSYKTCYRITEEGQLRYSRQIRVRALQNDLEDFVDRYNWTGRSQDLPRAGRRLVSVSVLHHRVGVWTYYRALFERPLRKGEVYTFEVVWPPKEMGEWVTSRPFVSASTDEPTRALEFEVSIPTRFRMDRPAIGRLQRAAESLVAFDAKPHFFNDGVVRWRIDKPLLYHYYLLHWSWRPDVAAVSAARPSDSDDGGSLARVA